MMNAAILNTVVGIFMSTLDGAFARLAVYSIPLLSILGLIYLLLAVGQMTMQSHSLAALGDFLWVTLKIGVVYFFAFAFYSVFWTAAFYSFLQWGLEGGSGGFGYESFLNPSSVLDTGFKAAAPLYDTLNNMGMFAKVDKPWTFAGLLIAYWLVVLSFGIMALHVIMTIIDIKLAIASAAVLFPWCMLTHTSILGELSLSWITAGLVRVLLTSLLMSIGVPLFEMANLGVSPATGGADPKFYGAATLAVVAFIFAVLSWVLPNRAAAIGGRGMALALGGDALVGGAMFGWSAAGATVHYARAAGSGVARGTSELVQSLRRAA
jgi:type IV secretory pathway TrbL component